MYLVAGDEPLLVDEALEAVRAAARGKGFTTRELHVTDRSFRWAELEGAADNLSLFATRKIVELRMPSPRPGDAGSKAIAALAERDDPDQDPDRRRRREARLRRAEDGLGQGDRQAGRDRRGLADRARRAAALGPAARERRAAQAHVRGGAAARGARRGQPARRGSGDQAARAHGGRRGGGRGRGARIRR